MRDRYQENLSNRYQVLQDLCDVEGVTDIETEWRRVKKVWTEACKETIGKKKTTHKDWMSLDTMEKIEKRKKLKAELNNC